jgi:hypothetical protein
MTERGIFQQNRIAIIWDFDRTLTPLYMQKPLFDAYGVDEKKFWDEVNALPAYYARAGIKVHPDTSYLGHLLTYVRTGRMKGLSNARLRELGKEITFFPGIPGIFDRLQAIVKDKQYEEIGLNLENYVVSTGIKEMINGSGIADKLDGVWASEFIEEAATPETDFNGVPASGEITQIAGFLDNTTKTRAIFEINKGVNKLEGKTVNDNIAEEDRRVPIKNMIYIADGPSDIPSFSVVKKHGGMTFAVYDPESRRQFEQVDNLQQIGRVHACGPADYTEGSHTDNWLRRQVNKIAERILDERKKALDSRIGHSPTHIKEG